jgi:hypothetical protein
LNSPARVFPNAAFPVSRVLEDQPDRRPIPGRFSGPRGDAVASQASADLTDGAPLLADPLEDLPHDPGLFGHDLIARLAATLVLADVAVAVRRAAEHVDRTAARRVLLAPAATLHYLGTLVLGDHALDLEQQVLLGAAADGVAQEHDLDAAPGQLFEDQDLIGIFARESVGVEHVDPVDGPGGSLVPEPLEAWAGQDGSAVAIVHEAQLGVALQGVACDPLADRLELTVNRVLLGLLFPGDAGIDRHSEMTIGHGWSSSPGLRLQTLGRRRVRHVVRAPQSRPSRVAGDDRDQGLVCQRDELILKPSELEMARDGRGGGGPPRRWDHVNSSSPRPRPSACLERGSSWGFHPCPYVGRSRALEMTESGIRDAFATLLGA